MSKKNLYILLFGLWLAGYAWVTWNLVGSAGHPATPTVCMFKSVTGIPCASCGTTRSLVALTAGDFQQSLLINPFGIVMALALLVVPLWIFIDVLRKRDSFYLRYRRMEFYVTQNRWISVLVVLIVLLNWVWNTAKGL